MKNNLVYVLAKVQFGQITESKFKDSADAVQEALRKDYPISNDNNSLMSFQFDVTNPHQHTLNQVVEKIINVSSANKEWGIRISRDYLFLQTKAYAGFDDFKSRLSYIIDIVEKNLNIYHTSFLGLRFVNKFKHNPETDFKDVYKRMEFLQPDINSLDIKMAGSNHHATYLKDTYWINVNSGISINGSKLPQDFADLPVDLGFQLGELLEGAWAHLDIDACYNNAEQMEEYSLQEIINKYKDLRAISNEFFQEIVYANMMTKG